MRSHRETPRRALWSLGWQQMTQIHARCTGPSPRALRRHPGHCCNSQLINQRPRNRCRVHTDWQIKLTVFIHYIRILSSVTMPTYDMLLRHFRKMLLRVGIRSCTLSSLIYSWSHDMHPFTAHSRLRSLKQLVASYTIQVAANILI